MAKSKNKKPEKKDVSAAPSGEDKLTGPPGPPEEAPQQAAADQSQQQTQTDFKIDESEASTIEADYFVGTFGLTEFLLAFGSVLRDGSRTIKIKDKVVMRAPNAKRVMLVLQQLIQRYEDQFGQIMV